jgi:hypothetical protein
MIGRAGKDGRTHGIEIIVYNIPILVPISEGSLILTTQGVIRLTKPPDRNPYTAAKARSRTRVRAHSQSVTHESPARKAAGRRRL